MDENFEGFASPFVILCPIVRFVAGLIVRIIFYDFYEFCCRMTSMYRYRYRYGRLGLLFSLSYELAAVCGKKRLDILKKIGVDFEK
jgi:hypothetical protein